MPARSSRWVHSTRDSEIFLWFCTHLFCSKACKRMKRSPGDAPLWVWEEEISHSAKCTFGRRAPAVTASVTGTGGDELVLMLSQCTQYCCVRLSLAAVPTSSVPSLRWGCALCESRLWVPRWGCLGELCFVLGAPSLPRQPGAWVCSCILLAFLSKVCGGI